MPVAEDDPRLVFVPVEKATVPPPGLIEHLKDRWWSVHPVKGLIFWNPDKKRRYLAPQCNGSQAIADDFRNRMYPWAETRFFPAGGEAERYRRLSNKRMDLRRLRLGS